MGGIPAATVSLRLVLVALLLVVRLAAILGATLGAAAVSGPVTLLAVVVIALPLALRAPVAVVAIAPASVVRIVASAVTARGRAPEQLWG